MFLRKKHLERRTFLKGGISGSLVSLGLPMLEIMLNGNGTALAQGGELPKRFVLFFFGSGVVPDRFYPTTLGANWLATPALMPLNAYRDRINIFSNLRVPRSNLDPHATRTYSQLSGTRIQRLRHNHSTIDQYLAGKISKGRTYESVQLRISNSVDSDGVVPRSNILSFNKNNAAAPPVPLVPDISPRRAFDRIFGSIPDKREFVTKKMMMDALIEDRNALAKKLGRADKYVLDEYFTQLNSAAKIIDDKFSKTCDVSVTQPNGAIPGNDLNERMRLMTLITNNILKCDLTRVVSILHSAPASSQLYPEIDANLHHHGLTHARNFNKLDGITREIMGHVNTLVDSLAKTPEGASNLLDQSIVYVASEETVPFHSFANMPVMMIGKGGNPNLKTGLHIDANGAPPVRTLLSAIRALNVDASDFPHDENSINNASGHFADLF